MPTTPVRGSGSPQQMSTPRQVGAKIQSPRTPQGLAMGGSRAMLARQGSPLQAPPMSHCPVASSLKGIPEVLTVQELAFRQGQLDHGVTCAQAPRSPFAEYYDYLWLEYYVLGKEVGGTPVSAPNTEQTSTIENFPWPILINPYTQGLQRPNGAVDADWVRKVCILALDCMAALVASVCRRQREWKTMVCDVPSPIRQAIKHFDDLEMRYQGLQKAAKEALAGGLPAGY
ncbi:hypothetical protein CC86DRAFT_340362 [Ophiobolus disseminans]|uniref:Uncharacterized protein n=1 Tax=Ophiobolus disseminans TaxID=1469910 RepID=A0A6A7AHD9_9PLEO|nr:hypothetical protein CC86DRAFT_340362 [Ophiobolus disseminans]